MASGGPDFSFWVIACGEYAGTPTAIALTDEGNVEIEWVD